MFDPGVPLYSSYAEKSIPLVADLKGSKTYRRRLRNAASAIYDLLRHDPVILSLSGKPAEYKGKERAIFPSFDPRGRTQTLAALEAVLHSCALMASYPAVPSGSGTPKRNEYVAVPLNGNDTVEGKPYGRLSHVGLVRAVLALAHYIPHGSTVPWLKLFYGFYDSETKRGISSRIQPSSDFLNWMMGRGLIFVGHPYGTDPKPASTDWPLLWVSQKCDGKKVPMASNPAACRRRGRTFIRQ